MKKKKISQLCAVTMAGVMLLAGCGNSGNSDNSSSAPAANSTSENTASTAADTGNSGTAATDTGNSTDSGEVVEISFTHWGGDDTYEGDYKARIEAFMGQHPNIRVTVQTVADDYETKIQTQYAGNKLPDVIQVAENGIGFATKGMFLDLSDRIAAEGIDTNTLWSNVIDQYTYNNEVFGLPDRGGCTIMYYNKDLFDDAGLAYPDENWTLDDYFTAVEKLTKDTDGDGVIDQWGTTSTHYQAIWGYMFQANGGSIIKDGQAVVNSPENLELLTKYNDAYQKGYVVSYEELEQANAGGDAYFQQGRLGMNLTGMWCIKSYAEEEGLNFDISTVPKGIQDAGWPMGSALAISKNSSPEKQEAAWEFVKYMTSTEAQAMLGDGIADCPANLEVLGSDAFTSQQVNGKDLSLNIIETSMERVTIDGLFRGPYYQEIIDEARNQMKEMLLGRLTPEQCLETMQTNFEDILSRY